MTLHVCVLASGSSGNSTVIWTDHCALLVDCGRSRRYIEESFRAISLDVSRLKGILITHGHGDHIGAGALRLAKAYKIPIYIHEETFQLINERFDFARLSEYGPDLIRHHPESLFSIGEFEILPFSTYHDGGFAGKTFGFSVTYRKGGNAYKVGCLTDTGKVNDNMVDHLLDASVLLLEANHDPELVTKSSRHYLNKKWILSDYGHLSNLEHARTVIKIKQRSKNTDALRHIFLGHISEQHNTPEHALEQVKTHLHEHGVREIKLIPTYHREKSIVVKVA